MGRRNRSGASHHSGELVVMDERARAILESAFATVERIDAQQTDWAAGREHRQAYAPPQQRQPSRRRRTVDNTTEHEQAAAPQMDRATQARWDAWANALVQAKMEAMAEVIGAEVGQMEKRFNEKLKVLEDKVAVLSAQVVQLENLRNYNVTQLPLPLRGRDVA